MKKATVPEFPSLQWGLVMGLAVTKEMSIQKDLALKWVSTGETLRLPLRENRMMCIALKEGGSDEACLSHAGDGVVFF